MQLQDDKLPMVIDQRSDDIDNKDENMEYNNRSMTDQTNSVSIEMANVEVK